MCLQASDQPSRREMLNYAVPAPCHAKPSLAFFEMKRCDDRCANWFEKIDRHENRLHLLDSLRADLFASWPRPIKTSLGVPEVEEIKVVSGSGYCKSRGINRIQEKEMQCDRRELYPRQNEDLPPSSEDTASSLEFTVCHRLRCRAAH